MHLSDDSSPTLQDGSMFLAFENFYNNAKYAAFNYRSYNDRTIAQQNQRILLTTFSGWMFP